MQRLVKLISSILLMFIIVTWTDKQGEAEPQEAMSQIRHVSSVIRSEQSAAERTIAHLFTEGVALPVSIVGELPGYHPSHSKPKRLHAAHRPDKYSTSSSSENVDAAHPHIPTPHHVIDYYIYTLEHILI